jgi:hypothetical protein
MTFKSEDVSFLVSDARREGFNLGVDFAVKEILDYLNEQTENFSNLQSMHKFRAIRLALLQVTKRIEEKERP